MSRAHRMPAVLGAMARAAALVVAALLVAGSLAARPARAQQAAKPARTRAARSCRVDTSGRWYRQQRAWADDSERRWSDDSLRRALLGAAGLDAATPDARALLGYELVDDARAAVADTGLAARMLDSLRALARNRQAPWPTRSVVGAAGVHAVWLLVASDSALSRTALHRMMEAGPDESPPAAVATLEDRLRVRGGRKQIYGTQLIRSTTGEIEPAPLEDPPRVDLRREGAGLPPIEQALCAARAPPGRR
jgi:hypothetical protein